MRDLFLIRPGVVYLNHGSFGACPRPVFDRYQAWQRELEAEPVEFLGRRFPALMRAARESLAAFVGADPDDLAFVPNATTGLNAVARSLRLEPGDEVLATDHEYGALDRTWTFVCEKRGARYVRRPLPLPIASAEEIVEAVWSGVMRPHEGPLPEPRHLDDGHRPAGGRTDPARARARHRHGDRRRPRARSGPARPRGARRRLLRRQLPQVDERAEGLGVPLRAPARRRRSWSRSS